MGVIGRQLRGAQHEGFRRQEIPDASHRDAVVGPDLGGRNRHSLDEAFEHRDRVLVPPLLVEVLGQVGDRVHVIGRHLERAPVASLGGFEIADLLQRESQVVEQRGMVGRERQRALEQLDGTRVLARLAAEFAEKEQRLGIVGRLAVRALPAFARSRGVDGSQRLREDLERGEVRGRLAVMRDDDAGGFRVPAGAERSASHRERIRRIGWHRGGRGRRLGVAAVAVLVTLAAAAGAGVVA